MVRVTFVHGFTQTGDSWARVIKLLPSDHHYLTIDAPGHGVAPTVVVDFDQVADQITEIGGQGVYCGYSMGARMCLYAALKHPTVVKGLILISGTAGINDSNERIARRESDRKLAARVLEIGVDQFIDEWMSQPMFNSLPIDEVDCALRRTNTAQGLANNLTAVGTGSQPPLWDRLGELTIPVLIIAGTNDLKFSALGERLHRLIGTSQLALVDNANHATHYEQPATVAGLIETWLNLHFTN
ncbi:MAG: alpha/beta fold hydrolase [Ilumatobacteraceae bacterium]